MVVARVGIEPTSQVFQTRAVTNLATSPRYARHKLLRFAVLILTLKF